MSFDVGRNEGWVAVEREQRRGELDVWDNDSRALRQGSDDRADQLGDRRTHRDLRQLHTDQPREHRTGTLGALTPFLPARATTMPVGERGLKRLPPCLNLSFVRIAP